MLSSQLLHRVLDTASTLAALDGDALDDGLPVLGRLLGADLVTYHRFDLLTRTEESVVCPEEALHEARRWPDYRTHLGQDPLLAHYATTGDAGARRLSDVAEVGVFRRSEVYQHYYRVAELKHQLALPVRGLPGQLVGFTLCRLDGQDFSDRDCDTLSLLGPHLERLHRQHLHGLHGLHGLHAGVAGGRPAPATETAALQLPRQRPAPADGRAALPRPTVPVRSSGVLAPLTQREQEVLSLSRAGHTSARLARELGISPRTVDKHLENAYRKLGVTSRVAAVLIDQSPPAGRIPA